VIVAERTIAIVDGNSLLHRAFHALPETLTGSDGTPTNAVYGFVAMLFKLVEQLEPDGVVVAWDCGRPQFRHDVLEQYKIHRKPTPSTLKEQFPKIKRLLCTMDVPCVEAEGWEGDDVLGTLAARASESGMRSLLITGDRDAMQLVTEDVSVVTTKKGVSEIVVYGPAEVEERLGVRPDQVPDYLGLKGDTSDNIPGVPGIGEKTAAKLMAEHGSLDEVLAHADDVKGKVGENLRAHADDARDSRLVATIRTDVPVDVDLETASWGGWDGDAVLEVFRDFRFTSLVGKIVEGAGAETVATSQERGLLPAHVGPDARARAEEVASTGEWTGVAVADAGASLLPTLECAVASSEEILVLDEGDAQAAVGALLADGRVASGDVKAVLQVVAPPTSEPRDDDPLDLVDPTRLFDCGIAAYLLDSSLSSYDVQAVVAEYGDGALAVGEDAQARMGADAQAGRELVDALTARLEEDASLECFERCEMALVPVLARMERVGVALDSGALERLTAEMGKEIASLVEAIHEAAGEEFNIDSPKQLAPVLFEKLGLPMGKRTKTGYSTDSSVLTPLAESYPIAGDVLAYRELSKLKSTYADALPRLVGEDGRLHTTFNQTVAATGRLSSSNPNLQNIPVRTELGRRIRAAFVPGDGFDAIVSADYSQIELRILAHLAEDEALIDAFTSGTDFHAATAARVFDCEPDTVEPELRARAKAVNFGIVYGISAHGLSESLRIGRAEAQEMIDRYFAAYPGVREFLDRTVLEARQKGYAVTLLGRRRPIPEFASSNHASRAFGERTAMNHPMQGAAADIMKLAMVEVDRRLREGGLASRMLLQVHDELVFEAVEGESAALESLVRDAMASAVELSVPLVVDVSSGPDWAKAK
jgi:DNA polymerase-1